MRTYKTELVRVDANALYGTWFKTQTLRDDDIIIMYAVFDHELVILTARTSVVLWVRREVGRVKYVL